VIDTDDGKGKTEGVRSAGVLAVLALFFSSVLFFYDLFGGRYLLIERDLGPYFIPPRFFWVESIKRWDFPLWNPYQFSGHPFFANPQHGILYPLNSLFFLLPFDMAFNAIIILHFFLGGLFTYLLLRDLKVNPTGALISGLIFMLSGYLLSVHSLLTILLSSIWTPLIMMFFRRAILKPGFKNEVLTAIFITISFLGGGLEVVYGNFFVLLFMVILSPATLPRSSVKEGVGEPLCGLPKIGRPRRAAPTELGNVPVYWGRMKPIFRRFRSLFIVCILFLFLSAVQLLPFLELFNHSIRGSGISYQVATIWSFAPKDILLFFLPDAYGYFLDMKKYWITQCWFKTLYTGGLPFILSLIFFLTPHSPKRVEEPLCGLPNQAATEGRPYKMCYFGNGRKLYFALMLFSLFFSLGKYNPLYTFVFKHVPFFNGIRYPAKFLYIFILVLSITAGLGFQKLSEYSKDNEKKRLKHLLIIFSLISGSLLLFSALGHKEVEDFLRLKGIDFPDFNPLALNLHHAQRFLFYLALFFLLLRVGYEVRWKGWVKVLLLIFLMTDLFGNMGFYGKEKTLDYLKKTKILEMISSDKGNFRIFATGKTISLDTPILIAEASPLDIFKEKHLPSLNSLFQMHDIWGIDVIRLKSADDLYRAFAVTPSISATNLIDLYGVKYVISVIPIEKDPHFELVYSRLEGLQGRRKDLLKKNTIKLYKNRNPLPRAWLVKDFKVMDPQTMLLMMIQKEFRPGREVFLEEEPKWINPPPPPLNSPTPPFVKGGEGGITKGTLGGLKEPLSGTQNKGGRRGSPLRRTNDVGEPPVPACGRQALSQKVEIISESNNGLGLQVKAAEDSLLVLSDTYYPGWKAFVDGKETKIYRADYTFRAIPLNAGTHRVEFVYDPMSFKLGAGVTILGILGCIGMGLAARYRRRGVPPRAPEIGRPQSAAPTKKLISM
jgi:hypothetical protein